MQRMSEVEFLGLQKKTWFCSIFVDICSEKSYGFALMFALMYCVNEFTPLVIIKQMADKEIITKLSLNLPVLQSSPS